MWGLGAHSFQSRDELRDCGIGVRGESRADAERKHGGQQDAQYSLQALNTRL